jgi:hypothetical protein
MNWALIVMICGRFCYPQYVELYTTQQECTQQIKTPSSSWMTQTHYCVPVAKK